MSSRLFLFLFCVSLLWWGGMLRAEEPLATVSAEPKRQNKYEMRYRYGYAYNYRPHAAWTPCPPGAGRHHALHYRGYLGLWSPRIGTPGPGFPPAALTPERGVITMPSAY